jgi:cellulose synthase/poly-beta-1,6-N-acetylglucosamine synthase-like glycosyltransferase
VWSTSAAAPATATRSEAELFAVFDADFVPSADVLLRMVPYFADPRVGMVQARWTHLNREGSLLTRVQAIFLDAHFAIESAARSFSGRFFNFNGTAGVWRRKAVEEAGGWSSSTLTEDLDLSYRAQLAGWTFVFLPDVEVPAELPAALSGFQEQQHRWAKGSIQTARKLGPSIVRSGFGTATKSEALFHLTNNCAYLLSLLVALLIVPSMRIRYAYGFGWTYVVDLTLFAISSGSVLLFYVEGQRIGMSVRNASAVLEGLFHRGGHFRRTPKTGDRGRESTRALRERPPRIPWGELALSLFFVGIVARFAAAERWLALPCLALFATGYGYIAIFALAERLTYARRRA